MRYSDDHDLELIDDVDDVVAECSKRKLSNPLRERLPRARTLDNERNSRRRSCSKRSPKPSRCSSKYATASPISASAGLRNLVFTSFAR